MIPSTYNCRKGTDVIEIFYGFAASEIEGAVAAAVRINREYIIEPLQPLVSETATQ